MDSKPHEANDQQLLFLTRVALGSLLTGLSVSDQKGNSKGRDIFKQQN
jgi:hypothetical protein